MNLPIHRRFQKVNVPFRCDNCGKEVPIAEKTCRNHCPYCLFSKHVDIFPGDRANPCQGTLRPVGYETDAKKGIVLLFQCKKCQQRTRNRALMQDKIASDDLNAILALSVGELPRS